jgi:hypothetical protein
MGPERRHQNISSILPTVWITADRAFFSDKISVLPKATGNQRLGAVFAKQPKQQSMSYRFLI